MNPTLNLPILVAGRRVSTDDSDELESLTLASGDKALLPRVSVGEIEDGLRRSRDVFAELRHMPIDDVTIYFDRVGSAWRDPANPWRKLVLEHGPSVTGYPRPFIEWDVNLMGVVLTRAEQYDFLEADLGDPTLLDEWERTKAVYQRYWPKGLVAHIMVGNVPMASLFTLYRSLATKNVTIAKLPSRDPLTALAFAQCMYDLDPDHPITRALSVMYWQPNCAVEDYVLKAADAVSVWGQAEAVESVKRRVPSGTDVIEFGPKRSIALVSDGLADYARTATKMMYDIVSYSQEGCFSLQETFFVGGDPEPLVEALKQALEGAADRFPRQFCGPDAEAHVQRARLEAEALGWEVHAPKGTDWTIIVTGGPCQIENHPLSRTLYIHPMNHWCELVPLIDRNVQTIALDPWDQLWDVADALSGAGADRIVQVGHMARFRSGFIHDGIRPMLRMVRLVSIERGRDYKYRFMTMTEEEDERAVYFDGVREYPYATMQSVIGGSQ